MIDTTPAAVERHLTTLDLVAQAHYVQGHDATADELRRSADLLRTLVAERDRLAVALGKAAEDLQLVGDDYPNSSCHKWCSQSAAEARAALSREP